MSANHTIQYLPHNRIDRASWDACIDAASNGLIYAYSWYLDAMADAWDALVLDDYKLVMPLPYRKKFGVYYLYQPFLAAQLGLFGNNIDANLLQQFLQSIPSRFRLWQFSLNHNNLFSIEDFPLVERMNYVLPLNEPYEKIYSGYRENIQRNIKKSMQYGCYVKTGIDVKRIIELTKQQATDVPEKDFERFEKLFLGMKNRNAAVTYGVYSKGDELLASCVFCFSHRRAYYILVGNHPNGRTLGASHALIDAFIKDHSNRDLVLDFEGSDLRNLAFFYSSFGAEEEKYPAIRLNRLPWYARWMKS